MINFIKFFIYGNFLSGLNNTEYINHHNSFDSSYSLEENKFIEREYINEFYDNNSNYFTIKNHTTTNVMLPIPKHSVDWRKENKVSSVKNQLDCGGCWAFSSVGAVESLWAIKKDKLYDLSEQELIDCSSKNQGCEGGSMDLAFEYIINNGLCSNNSYPYVATDEICNNTCESLVTISDFRDVTQNNEKSLMRAVSQQPVSVAIQANKRSFQFYKSGIYSDPNCGFQLDHGVLLVGYGYDKTYDMDYWIIKNSWGEDWGEDGYVRIIRNIDDSRGLCGVAMIPSYPLIN